MFVIDTIDGITLSTTSDTSEVITLDDVVSVELFTGAVLLTEEDEEDSSSPKTLFPTMFDVKNVALDTTPNNRASPVTAIAFGIFFRCGLLPFGWFDWLLY
jgi:hypothetical protein